MTTQSFLKKINMIGREDLMEEVRAWREDGGFHLAFYNGGYGMGKTYLLQSVAREYDFVKAGKPQLIDLYHFKNHTPEGLARAIFGVFKGKEEEYFKSYLAVQRKLDDARTSGDGKASAEQLQKLLDSCVKALREISANHGLMLLFDTAERFVYGGGRFAPAWEWAKGWLKELPRGVVLFAGRTEAKPLFEGMGVPYRDKPLIGFTLEQTRLYIAEVSKRMEESGKAPLQMNDDDISKVHALSEGRPILLAMFMETKLRNVKAELLDAGKNEFESKLIGGLLSLEDNLGAAIRAAGRTRKGMTAELLRRIAGIGLREARDALDAMKEMAFCKTFAGDEERVFLHDDMYDLLETYVYGSEADAADKQGAAQMIYEYYNEEVEKKNKEIGAIFAELVRKADAGEEIDDLARDETVKRLRAMETARQRLKTEFIHYRLRSQIEVEGKRKAKEDDPVFAGLKMYYRFGHEAATTNNDEILAPLEIELTDFWLRLDDDNSWKPFVEGMLLINEVWLGVATGKSYEEKIVEVREKIKQIPRMSSAQKLALDELLETWRGTRMIFSDSPNYEGAEAVLGGVIERLEKNVKPEAGHILWFLRAVISLAYRQRAYARRIRGAYADSVEDFLKGLRYVRFVHYYHEEATFRNDLGFAQTLKGDFVDAYENLQDGLKLRYRVAIGHRLALTYSSLAQHFLAKGSYEDARKNALYAMFIASAVSFRRGIAFGNLAYAEAMRRLASLAEEDSLRQTYLNDAKKAIEQARHLLEQLNEKARILDATLEEGCVYRDLCRIEKDAAQKKFYFEKADELLVKAADDAAEQKVYQRQADAECNRIWLGYYTKDPDYLAEAIEKFKNLEILKPYWLKDGKFANEAEARKNPALWAQIGKFYIGRGMMEFSDWRKKSNTGGSEDTSMKNQLQRAARYIALGLRYSSEFGPDHRGMREARRTILDALKTLNPDNLAKFSRYVLLAEESEHLADKESGQSPLQKLMRAHALWYGDNV